MMASCCATIRPWAAGLCMCICTSSATSPVTSGITSINTTGGGVSPLHTIWHSSVHTHNTLKWLVVLGWHHHTHHQIASGTAICIQRLVVGRTICHQISHGPSLTWGLGSAPGMPPLTLLISHWFSLASVQKCVNSMCTGKSWQIVQLLS